MGQLSSIHNVPKPAQVRITGQRMTVSQLRSDLQGSRARLFDLIRGLSEEQFRYASESERWSIATHLAHLLRIERLFAERASRALREDEPYMASTRVHNDEEPGNAQRLAVPQIIHGMQASRRDLERVLDACQGDAEERALDRAIVHERIGRMTVAQIIVKMADHEREHADQVAALARQALSASHVIIPLKPRS
jgi:uncharacterized damage-inducible protein DinB